MIERHLLLTWLLLLSACAMRTIETEQAASLPQKLPMAVSNNAVAYVATAGGDQFYTFNGLLAGKSYQDITNQAFVWQSGQWHQLQVPAAQAPVLASTAVTVGQHVYLIGGYTVAADHSEKSIPNVWKIDAESHQWLAMPVMPTPVDDTVALVYQDRYIYLVSGWHDVDNVDLVQVFDTLENTWHQATPFPLPAVFGHAGGIIDGKMIICDGVKVVKTEEKKQFLASPACTIGHISTTDFTQIEWQNMAHHSGTAYYRMAAAADDLSQIYFIGGSDNPYNYDGVGYNQLPAQPSSQIRVYDLNTQQWTEGVADLPASMDHRALLNTPHALVILGGMAENQTVVDRITYYKK
jgi:N-acetylneuraminic acid mutarotase